MNHLGALSSLVAALALAAVVAGTALAAQTMAFKGTYAGKVTEKVDGQAVTAAASGAGSGTVDRQGQAEPARSSARRPTRPARRINGPGDDLRPAGKLKITRRHPLARLRRVRGRPGQHHGLRHRQGQRRHAQVQEGQGLAALQRPLRPQGRHLQREAHGQPDLLDARTKAAPRKEVRSTMKRILLPALVVLAAFVACVPVAARGHVPFPAVHSR